MKINNISNEVINIEDGTYKGIISDVISYENNNKVLMKIALNECDMTFIKFYYTDELGEYPWNTVFKALDSNDTDDLVDKSIKFEVVNHTSDKTGTVFSNIKKIKLVSE